MCKAFSCIIGRDKKVTWKLGIDSHDDLIKMANYKDDTLDPDKIQFCRIEIAPNNGDYLEPDKWNFRIDMDITPKWWTLDHKKACCAAQEEWLKELNVKLSQILIKRTIEHPFKIVPPKITKKHLKLLKVWDSVRASVWDSVGASVGASVWDSVGDSVWDSVRASVWDSVRASVGDSVWDSVGDSVWDSVWDSVRASVWDSVWASVWDSVWDSVGASVGSMFNLPRKDWEYTDNIKLSGYPFQSAVDLWDLGLVPSFDGETWRLHGGSDAKVLWQGTKEDLQNL